MDLQLYRWAGPRLRLWPGTGELVGLRPLPVADIEQARVVAAQHYQAHGWEPDGAAELLCTAEILARALCEPEPPHDPLGDARWLLASTIPPQLEQLAALWLEVDTEHLPDQRQLEAEIELRIAEGDGVAIADGVAAISAQSPAEFYGVPGAQVTAGQLLYFSTLSAVYHRSVDRSRKRWVSKKALRKQAGRSEPTSRRAGMSRRSHGRARSARSASWS